MHKVADIFCGCGGLTAGFYENKNFEEILAVDSWAMAVKVFNDNYQGNKAEVRDLYDPNEVDAVIKKLIKNKCDVIIGGPPCQGFSTLGKRSDNDKRSSLVEVFLRICKEVKPAVILMENVRGIMSKMHRSGVTVSDFVRDSLKNGTLQTSYDAESVLIKTYDYGLAQTRIRWFMVAVRSDINEKKQTLKKIVESIERQKVSEKLTLKNAIGDLPSLEAGEGGTETTVGVGDNKKTVFNHKAMNHSPRLLKRFSYVPVGGGLLDVPRRLLNDHLKRMIDGEYGDGGHIKNIYGRLDWQKPSGTIVAGIDKITCGRFLHPKANRLLTPRECARIQSFSDAFRFSGSMVNQYYLIGNAVPPKISSVFANAIAKGMADDITKKRGRNPEKRLGRKNNREFVMV